MSRQIVPILSLLAGLSLSACRHGRPSEPPADAVWTPEHPQPKASPPAPAKARGNSPAEKAETQIPRALARFRTATAAKEQAPFLAPAAEWRFWVSRITTLRADGSARGVEVLVRFEKDSVTVFRRGEAPERSLLPRGLVFSGVPSYLLLLPDLTVRLYDREGKEVPTRPEAAVVAAKIAGAGGKEREFRLLVKGGGSFRSIETPG